IKGLGAKTIATNRGNTDVVVLSRINFESKRDLNLMGIFTVKEFFEADDDSLTNTKGIRSPTIAKLKMAIEERLLMTPGTRTTSQPKITKKPASKSASKKTPTKTTTTKVPEKRDQTIAEFLGTKKPKAESEEEIKPVRGPPKGLLDPNLKISKLPGMGKTTEERFAAVGVKTVGDIFRKSIKRLATIRGVDEKDIIEMRKLLSVDVLPHVTAAVKIALNEVGIYTVKQFQSAKIAKTSAVKGLGVKTVKAIRKHILTSLKTSAELKAK
ncbi:MAG: helix-hairpin-helix domain-containing protein, partial [Candidatus Heimdallarchaeota archaeon]